MTDHNTQCRKEFEEWFLKETSAHPARKKDGEYKYSLDRNFWYAWQAGYNRKGIKS